MGSFLAYDNARMLADTLQDTPNGMSYIRFLHFLFLVCCINHVSVLVGAAQACHCGNVNHVRFVTRSFLLQFVCQLLPIALHHSCNTSFLTCQFLPGKSNIQHSLSALSSTIAHSKHQSSMANNPGTNSAANLLSLPPQIMEAVANQLPQEDLPSLRLVCRDINSKITRSFEQRCIADKRVVVGSPRSMQNLENLSNHPRFGNILQRITLVLQDLHYSPLEPGLKRWASEIRSDKATVSIEHRAEYSRLRQVYHGMILQQKKFAEGSTGDANGWNRVLARSLKNLEARNTNGLAITATCQR